MRKVLITILSITIFSCSYPSIVNAWGEVVEQTPENDRSLVITKFEQVDKETFYVFAQQFNLENCDVRWQYECDIDFTKDMNRYFWNYGGWFVINSSVEPDYLSGKDKFVFKVKASTNEDRLKELKQFYRK